MNWPGLSQAHTKQTPRTLFMRFVRFGVDMFNTPLVGVPMVIMRCQKTMGVNALCDL